MAAGVAVRVWRDADPARSEAFARRSAGRVYRAVVEELDWSVGQIVGGLRVARLERNTLVVLTSENERLLPFGAHAGQGRYKAHFITSGAYGVGGPRTVHDPPLLFDLAEDPGERVDVAVRHPEVGQPAAAGGRGSSAHGE